MLEALGDRDDPERLFLGLHDLRRGGGRDEQRDGSGEAGAADHAQYSTTDRIDFPACIRSNASLIRSSGIVWVMRSSMLILLVHVPVDDLRHVGAPARAAERGALPHAAGHELERPRADLLPGAGDADDGRDAPARWQHSSAWRIRSTLPTHSKL